MIYYGDMKIYYYTDIESFLNQTNEINLMEFYETVSINQFKPNVKVLFFRIAQILALSVGTNVTIFHGQNADVLDYKIYIDNSFNQFQLIFDYVINNPLFLVTDSLTYKFATCDGVQ